MSRLRFLRFCYILLVTVPETGISQKAQQFLAQNIHSVEQLEIFLTLAEEPGRFWSVRQIFQKVQSSEKSIADCLNGFVAASVARKDDSGAYRLSDQVPGLDDLAAELKKAYRERRVTVIELIYQKPPPQIQSFADAFRLRKEK